MNLKKRPIAGFVKCPKCGDKLFHPHAARHMNCEECGTPLTFTNKYIGEKPNQKVESVVRVAK